MGRWYSNQGWNRNLMVQLSGGQAGYQIDVYVVIRFRFFYEQGAQNWSRAEARAWKSRFANLVYRAWSEKWRLLSDINCALIDLSQDRSTFTLPTARVRVHAVDVEAPSVRLISRQHIYAVNVYRQPPGAAQNRLHADALPTSQATVGQIAQGGELPRGTSEAHLYEDSLELDQPGRDGHRQVPAMHEFGHMLGLMHPNDQEQGCVVDRSASICYGQLYSPESASIMGRGREVRRQDYSIFVNIISRLASTTSQGGLFGGTRHLMWWVEGTSNPICNGQRAQLQPGIRGTRAHTRTPGPLLPRRTV